ncbi:MAG: aldo/keto reductase family protein [Planctomycetes bacterium]|nr:aldo/keto reductase family protein [Planctomycetota bacterium]
MKYRRLGRAGVRVSEISFGTWLTFGGQVDLQTAHACLDAAWDCGINFYDTADVYNQGAAEQVLGAWLRKKPRKDYVVATKVFFPTGEGENDKGLSRKHIVESCEASLRRLNVEYVDLYQCHRFDDTVRLDETVRAMDDLIRQGKILYWGVSQWEAPQIEQACRIAEKRNADLPVSNQPRYNLLSREIELQVIPTCEREEIGQIVWSPLAQGLLTGKYGADAKARSGRASDARVNSFLLPWMTEENLRRAERFTALARELGHTPAQLALAWCLRLPNIASTIIGASRPEQVRENVAASGLELSADLLRKLDSL